jgi:hypothetical protein
MPTLLHDLCSRPLQERRAWLQDELVRRFGHRVTFDIYAAGTNMYVDFGDNPSKLLVAAHYDVVEYSEFSPGHRAPFVQGANDNAAAVVELIMAAQAILDSEENIDVRFAFFDHEEWFGSPDMGSAHYSQTVVAPDLAIILDVTGIGNLYWSTTQTYLPESWQKDLFVGLPCRTTPPSDSLNFIRKGIPVVLLCCLPESSFALKSPPEWSWLHTELDSEDTVNPETLETVSRFVVDLVRRSQKSILRD